MKHYILNKDNIPSRYLYDCMELQSFIENSLDIHISLRDTYEFWSKISESWEAGWLSVTTHYEDETREEFLLQMLEKFGQILEE